MGQDLLSNHSIPPRGHYTRPGEVMFAYSPMTHLEPSHNPVVSQDPTELKGTSKNTLSNECIGAKVSYIASPKILAWSHLCLPITSELSYLPCCQNQFCLGQRGYGNLWFSVTKGAIRFCQTDRTNIHVLCFHTLMGVLSVVQTSWNHLLTIGLLLQFKIFLANPMQEMATQILWATSYTLSVLFLLYLKGNK